MNVSEPCARLQEWLDKVMLQQAVREAKRDMREGVETRGGAANDHPPPDGARGAALATFVHVVHLGGGERTREEELRV